MEKIKHDDFIEVRLPRLHPCLKNTSRGFPNPLFDNLLLGEDQTVTNLPYTVKSNHNLDLSVKSNHRVKNPFHSLGFIPKP